jgi:hypothetical protein
MPFLEISLNNLFSKLPIFKDKDGTRLVIKIEFKAISTVYISVDIRNKSNYPMRLQDLNRSQMEFFLKEYRNFIGNNEYNKSKSILGKIQSAIQITLSMLKNKKISKFYFSLQYDLPLTNIINKLYTIDKFDDKCIAVTIIEKGKMYNIYDPNSLNRMIPLFHNLSLGMIYDLNLNENKYYIHIFEKMKLYLRIIIPTVISIAIINNSIINLHSNPIEFAAYIFTFIISLFPNIVFKTIINLFIYIFIKKNFLTSLIEETTSFLKRIFLIKNNS